MVVGAASASAVSAAVAAFHSGGVARARAMVVRATTSASSSAAKLAAAARRRGRRRRKLWCQKNGQRLAWAERHSRERKHNAHCGTRRQVWLRALEVMRAGGGVNGEMMELYLRANLHGNVDRL